MIYDEIGTAPGSQRVAVALSGCDDGTQIEIDVSPSELAFLLRLRGLFDEASDCGCQPTMTVEGADA